MKKFHDIRSQKGWTLAEVMIILAIVAILAGVSIPVWSTYMPTMRLNGATNNLQMALALARMKAVARNQRMGILLTKNPAAPHQDYRIQKWNSTTNIWDEEVGTEREMAPSDLATQGITLTVSGFANNRIIFNSRGMCIDDAGNTINNGFITLKNRQNKTRRIDINGTTGIATLS